MSDTNFAAYEVKCAAVAALQAEVLPSNKQALFDALAVAGIRCVVVSFDGYGDSGQIETADGFDAENNPVDLPPTLIEHREVDFESATIVAGQKTPSEVIETMVYRLLQNTHGGWQDNDGAYGEFTFDVGERTIALDFNERFTDSTNYQHEF